MSIKHDREAWQDKAQPGEFNWHVKNKWRPSPAFMEQTIGLFDWFGFHREQYAGRTVIDLGAGSKLRTKYFLDARLVAIEPLADRFRAEIDWCDLDDAAVVEALPAEQLIDAHVRTADLVISINVLDHCFDFERIIENVMAYMRHDGTAMLSFDKHTKTDSMHPLVLTEEVCEATFDKYGLRVVEVTKGGNGMLRRNTYGHGPYCLNYRLVKA